MVKCTAEGKEKIEDLPPDLALQLVGACVVDRRVEAPVKPPAHVFNLAVRQHDDARQGLRANSEVNFAVTLAHPPRQAFGPAFRLDAVGVAHGTNLKLNTSHLRNPLLRPLSEAYKWMPMYRLFVILALLGMAGAATADDRPVQLLPIGDSLTEEYRFMPPFSAPGSDPLTANTFNWVEILAAHRANEISFGSYDSTPGYYGDYRNAGFRYNFGVPGFTTSDWLAVLNAKPLDFSTTGLLRTSTRSSLINRLNNADAAMVFLGGNDLKSDYSGIFHNDDPPPLLDAIVSRLTTIHDWVRGREPGIPIFIATVPDIGATPDIAGNPSYADPAKRERARARIAAMNGRIMAMAAARNAGVVRVDRLTDAVFDAAPFHLNGTEFSMVPDRENPPLHAFTRDGFHPSTVAQALIANEVLLALGRAPIPARELLADILGLDPDQPFLDWAEDALPQPAGVGGDTAGIPNLARYLFDLPADDFTRPLAWRNGRFETLAPHSGRLRFASFAAEESATMEGGQWLPIPGDRLIEHADGTLEIIRPDAAAGFFRLRIAPRP